MPGRGLSAGACVRGRYRVERRLGGGGMGDVYQVLDEHTQRRRALKAMRFEVEEEPDLAARFEREVTITADIKSEHIVEVLDAGVDDATGTPFIVMELLDGQDLDAVLKERGRLAPDQVLLVVAHVARALRKTHAIGVVHRDLKPGNLFEVTRDDGAPLIKLLDFGVAKIRAESAEVRTTLAIGTPYYMSPEQHRGDGRIGPAADLYALGHVTFTLLVGEPYWKSLAPRRAALALAILEGATEPASVRAKSSGVNLPAAFDGWFSRATAVRPEDRFGSAYEMVRALAAVLELPLPRPALFTLAEAPPSIDSSPLSPRNSTLDLGTSPVHGSPSDASPRRVLPFVSLPPSERAASLAPRRPRWTRVRLPSAVGVLAVCLLVAAGWTLSSRGRAAGKVVRAAPEGRLAHLLPPEPPQSPGRVTETPPMVDSAPPADSPPARERNAPESDTPIELAPGPSRGPNTPYPRPPREGAPRRLPKERSTDRAPSSAPSSKKGNASNEYHWPPR